MNAQRAGTRAARVKIRDERQRRRKVERLADAHERTTAKHLRIRLRVAGEPRHRRPDEQAADDRPAAVDRKSTRLNSSHLGISYAVFCLKKNKEPYFILLTLDYGLSDAALWVAHPGH